MDAFILLGTFFGLMLMNGIVNLATTIPSAPGYVGTFDTPGIAVLAGNSLLHLLPLALIDAHVNAILLIHKQAIRTNADLLQAAVKAESGPLDREDLEAGIAGIVRGSERPMGRMQAIASAWSYTGEYRDVDTELKNFDAVTLADVRKYLDQYPIDRSTVIAFGPAKELGGIAGKAV